MQQQGTLTKMKGKNLILLVVFGVLMFHDIILQHWVIGKEHLNSLCISQKAVVFGRLFPQLQKYTKNPEIAIKGGPENIMFYIPPLLSQLDGWSDVPDPNLHINIVISPNPGGLG